jgi:hypothetical protein
MANASAGNVRYVDTDGTTFSGPMRICGIKYIGNTSGTAIIRTGLTAGAGARMWEGEGATDFFEDAEIVANDGINIALTNGAVLYIYLLAE